MAKEASDSVNEGARGLGKYIFPNQQDDLALAGAGGDIRYINAEDVGKMNRGSTGGGGLGHPPKIRKVEYGEHIKKGFFGREELKPNVQYVTEDGYKYTTDDLGRIVNVEADNLVLKEGTRNESMQRVVGRQDRLPDDDGGHLIATQFNGPGDIDNLVAQNKQINRAGGEWYKMEMEWAQALKEKPPKNVSVNINPVYSGSSLRPNSFEVIYKIEGEDIVEVTIMNQAGG